MTYFYLFVFTLEDKHVVSVSSLISRILSLGYWSVCREMHVLSAKQLLKCAGLKDPSQ